MSYYVIKIWSDGTVERYPSEQKPSLDFLYGLIDCDLVETVNLWGNKIMIVDEEGWLKESPVPNPRASLLYSGSLSSIAGNVVIMKRVINDWRALTGPETEETLRDIDGLSKFFAILHDIGEEGKS